MTYIPTFKKSNLVLNLPFSEGTGTTAYDYSGEGNNGTIYGATYVKVSDGGGALSFDGTNDYSSVSLSLSSGAKSISCWAYPTADDDAAYIVHGHQGVTNNRWAIIWFPTDTTYNGFGGTIGDGSFPLRSSSVDAINNWYHLVITRSGNTISLYVNGNLRSSSTYTSSADSSGNVVIGAARSNLASFTGIVDEVLIFNTALTADEVATLYKQTYKQ